jgi:hypothetical protein
MNERESARAQSESLAQAKGDKGDERSAVESERGLQRYLAAAYYTVLGRTARRSETRGKATTEERRDTP